MAKKTNAPICDRCETPIRSASPFCPACGGPTQWASHDERVDWEVRQWRASRASSERDKPQMMLVRTEAGYQPMAVARYNDYVWDQPLHPEREAKFEARPAAATDVVHRPDHVRTNNGNGIHGPAANRPPPPEPHPEPQPATAIEAPPPHEPQSRPDGSPETPVTRSEVAGMMPGSAGDRVTVSIRSVALALALVVGLLFGGKILGLADGDPALPAREGVVPGRARPVALVAARSGFEQLSPDAVRYAVVIHNPNTSFQASGVTVSVVVHDASGRLVGAGIERISAVPAAGALGVAGAIGVSGPATKLTVKVGTSTFQESPPAKPFIVRNVRLGRSGGQLVVRADVSGVQAAKGARVVAVHLDRSRRVVGGDFTYVDVPRTPKSVTAVIPTTGVRQTVTRVEVYVLPR